MNTSFRTSGSQLVLLLVAAVLFPHDLRADVFTVVNANPAGVGSLAQAIDDAKVSEEPNEIVFAIPGPGVHRIDVGSNPLPGFFSGLTIDGYTQPGAKANTLNVGSDAVILIQIDGGGPWSTTSRGLVLGCGSTIRGLSLTGFARAFSGAAIAIDAGDTNAALSGNRVEGNFIGLAPDGITVSGNYHGVRLTPAGGGNTVGGNTPASRNVIAGNDIGIYAEVGGIVGNYIGWDPSGLAQGFGNQIGIVLLGPATRVGGSTPGAGNVIGNNVIGVQAIGFESIDTEMKIQGNLIGPRADGGAAFGNQTGIEIMGDATRIGGLGTGEGNVVAFNRTGIAIRTDVPTFTPVKNSILSNLIYANPVIDIDLGDDGPTRNDFRDGDEGPNRLQNFPVITTVTRSASATTVAGGLDSAPSTTFTLQFFATAGGSNPNQVLLGTGTVTTDGAGDARFEFSFPVATALDEVVTATATDPEGNTSEFLPASRQGELANISARANVGTGDNILIGGFISNLSSARSLLVRALGPSLPTGSRLADPELLLLDGNGAVVAQNDDWKETQEQAIRDTGLAPSHDLESALLVRARNGAYTAQVRGANGGTGIGLVEIYALGFNASQTPRELRNISARGHVGTGNDVLIGGAIVQGSAAQRVIIRAIGPELVAGVPAPLQDPMLELRDAQGNLLMENDDWRSDQEKEIFATGLAPGDERDSAIVATLLPTARTVIVRGKGNATGIALLEFYTLD